MIMQIINLKSSLPENELVSKAKERLPQFQSVPGLLQKYYVKKTEGEYTGVYIWDSRASLAAFRESELAKTIPSVYQVSEAPFIEVGDILFTLREK